LPSYEPDDDFQGLPVVTQLAVLFVAACFFTLGLILYVYA
jgi:uncharacterized membrane protein